ncbi:MAG: DNA-binding domain-containing protein [Pseudomonadota bacterium]
MHSLADLQSNFKRSLVDLDGPVPTAIKSERAGERFNIYRNNVVASLIDALADNFPAVKTLVGDAFFKAVAKHWVLDNQPDQPMLFSYGAGFADFLDHFEPARAVPYLADIARLEQARREAYHAADGAPISIASLQDIPPHLLGDAIFILHPAARLVQSGFPVQTIWESTLDKPSNQPLDLSACPAESVLVTRPALDVEHQVIDHVTLDFINALGQGLTLHQAMSSGRLCPDTELPSILSTLFNTGAVGAITLTDDPQ